MGSIKTVKKTKDLKKLLIHDLEKDFFPDSLKNYNSIISDDGSIHNCIGCFGCWVKTPGICVIKDNYNNMGKHLAENDEVTIISKCLYGGVSPFIKNILDRSIPYIHPYFVNKNKEMHHRQRYKKTLNLKVIFYGDDLTPDEKETAKEWVNAMAVNLYCNLNEVIFIENPSELEGLI